MPLDQTDLTSGQDGCSETVEESSGRGPKTLAIGGRAAPWWGSQPHLVASAGLVASGVF